MALADKLKFSTYFERVHIGKDDSKPQSSHSDKRLVIEATTTPPATLSRPGASRTSSNNDKSSVMNPFSAFYSHPSSHIHGESKTELPLHDKDIEAGATNKDGVPRIMLTECRSAETMHGNGTDPKAFESGRSSMAGTNQSSVWPSQRELREKAREAKRQRRNRTCSAMAGLSKRTRLLIKILIALLVIGAAVGIGVGISRAVGGTVYKSENSNSPIPNDQD